MEIMLSESLASLSKNISEIIHDHRILVEFAVKHHEVCEDCEGTGKIYKHHDPTTGQWMPCPIAELLHLDGAVRGGECEHER